MFPDESYADATGSFKRPVAPPIVDPDSEPTQEITISCAWLPYVRGALQQLLLQSTWNTSDPAVLALIQGRVWNLIDLFQECEETPAPFVCVSDFSVGEVGWQIVYDPDYTPALLGFYEAGSGFRSACVVNYPYYHAFCFITDVFGAPVHLTRIELYADLVLEFCGPGAEPYITVYLDQGSGLIYQGFFSYLSPSEVGPLFAQDGDWPNVRQIQFNISASNAPSGSCTCGDVIVHKIVLYGEGLPPC